MEYLVVFWIVILGLIAIMQETFLQILLALAWLMMLGSLIFSIVSAVF